MNKTLWNYDILKRSGHQMNQDLLRAFHEYCSGGKKPIPMDLLAAATFTGLVLANMNPTPKKRDLMYTLLQGPVTDITYRKLKMFKWTPIQSILQAYSGLQSRDFNPSLPRLLELQKERLQRVSPSWGALMPDKIYALAQFTAYPPEQLDKIMLPFSKQVQVAFGAYAGVEIKGQPKMIHHEYLRNFCSAWAHNTGSPDAGSLAVNSGLQIFGESLLQE